MGELMVAQDGNALLSSNNCAPYSAASKMKVTVPLSTGLEQNCRLKF